MNRFVSFRNLIVFFSLAKNFRCFSSKRFVVLVCELTELSTFSYNMFDTDWGVALITVRWICFFNEVFK